MTRGFRHVIGERLFQLDQRLDRILKRSPKEIQARRLARKKRTRRVEVDTDCIFVSGHYHTGTR